MRTIRRKIVDNKIANLLIRLSCRIYGIKLVDGSKITSSLWSKQMNPKSSLLMRLMNFPRCSRGYEHFGILSHFICNEIYDENFWLESNILCSTNLINFIEQCFHITYVANYKVLVEYYILNVDQLISQIIAEPFDCITWQI